MGTSSRVIAVAASVSLLTVLGAAGCKSKTTTQTPTPETSGSSDLAAAGESGSESGSALSGEAAGQDGHEADKVAWKTAVDPKPMSNQVTRGLEWLVAHQLDDGGWGQGDESRHMRGSNQAQQRSTSNVADTSMALMALMRSGSTARSGAYQKAIRRGLGFIMAEIEESDDGSLYVTDIRGTRVQGKIGTYVDTFTALAVLTEAKSSMPDQVGNRRLEKSLDKILAKIEKNQRSDGTWDNRGWAPVLSQSMAAKSLNRAAQSGLDVKDETLARVENQAKKQFDSKSGKFGSGGSAGIELYAGAANSSTMRDSVSTRKLRARKMSRRAAKTRSAADQQAAERETAAAQTAEIATDTAEKALIERLEDPNFVQGFGNNGGEEFLSYMLVSESLIARGGDDWKTWDARITKLINHVQNGDGSWTGHHCITGRTFCTAAALLVLMADRTPVAVAAQIKG